MYINGIRGRKPEIPSWELGFDNIYYVDTIKAKQKMLELQRADYVKESYKCQCLTETRRHNYLISLSKRSTSVLLVVTLA